MAELSERLTATEKSLLSLTSEHKSLQREHATLRTDFANITASLKTVSKQRDELAGLLRSIAEREEVKTEREMIAQIARLEEEVARLRKEAQTRAPLDLVSSRLAVMSTKRRVEVPSEKRTAKELFVSDFKALLEAPNDAERRRVAIDTLFAKGDKIGVLSFLNAELATTSDKAASEVQLLARGFEAMLNEEETQSEFFRNAKEEAETRASGFAGQVKSLTAQVASLNSKISMLLKENESLSLQFDEIEKRHLDMTAELEGTRKSMSHQALKEKREKENEFLEALKSIEILEQENRVLKAQVASLSKVHSSAEQISQQTETHVEELQLKLVTLNEELLKLKKKTESAAQEKAELQQTLEQRSRALDEIKVQHAETVEKMQIQHAAELRQVGRHSRQKSLRMSQVSQGDNLALLDSAVLAGGDPTLPLSIGVKMESSVPLFAPKRLADPDGELDREGDAYYLVY